MPKYHISDDVADFNRIRGIAVIKIEDDGTEYILKESGWVLHPKDVTITSMGGTFSVNGLSQEDAKGIAQDVMDGLWAGGYRPTHFKKIKEEFEKALAV